ncbi:MAG: hypothetical protein HOE69_04760 [Euryarchaeota archaeon]|jgi:hypothetical protein|nr:hypothetical protein [Euryarchaeota archaeon]
MVKTSAAGRKRAQRSPGLQTQVTENTGAMDTGSIAVIQNEHTFASDDNNHADIIQQLEFDVNKYIPNPMDEDWPRQSILHGCVLDVEWKGGGGRLNDMVPSFDSAEVDIAVGNNQSEAAAALIAKESSDQGGGATKAVVEESLAAFGEGLFSELDAPDGAYRFEHAIHDHTFTSNQGGFYYDEVRERTEDGETSGSEKYATYAAPRFHEPRDPVIMFSNTHRSTRHGGDGDGEVDGRLACRYSTELFNCWYGDPTEFGTVPELMVHGGIPVACSNLLAEASILAQGISVTTGPGAQSTLTSLESLLLEASEHVVSSGSSASHAAFHEAGLIAHFRCSWDGVMPSRVAINFWRQAWVPLNVDLRMNWHPVPKGWSLGDSDFELIDLDLDNLATPITITRTSPLTATPGNLFANRIRAMLEEEDLLDERDAGQFDDDSGAEEDLEQLAAEFETMDILGCVLTGLNKTLIDTGGHSNRAGVMTVERVVINDAYGQVRVVQDSTLTDVQVAKSLETEDDSHQILFRPRLPVPARLMLRLQSQDDSGPATLSTSPVCGFILPDHLEWAMEFFDRDGMPLGQLDVAERDWSRPGGDQGGRIVWQPPPGSDIPTTIWPETDQPHLNALLFSMLQQGLTDSTNSVQESAFSAMIRAIDTTLGHMDSTGKGGDQYLSTFIGRPIAVVRAQLHLELDLSNPDGDPLSMDVVETLSSQEISVRLGAIARATDGLLGYFVNDDYTLFNTVYPIDSDKTQPELPAMSVGNRDAKLIEHNSLVFDPTVELQHGLTVNLTLLMHPQSGVHANCGFLPQKEIVLMREHYEDALERIAPTFKFGPVLMNPEDIVMPSPELKGLRWSWIHRPSYTNWSEKGVNPEAGSLQFHESPPQAIEGWLKLADPDATPPPYDPDNSGSVETDPVIEAPSSGWTEMVIDRAAVASAAARDIRTIDRVGPISEPPTYTPTIDIPIDIDIPELPPMRGGAIDPPPIDVDEGLDPRFD